MVREREGERSRRTCMKNCGSAWMGAGRLEGSSAQLRYNVMTLEMISSSSIGSVKPCPTASMTHLTCAALVSSGTPFCFSSKCVTTSPTMIFLTGNENLPMMSESTRGDSVSHRHPLRATTAAAAAAAASQTRRRSRRHARMDGCAARVSAAGDANSVSTCVVLKQAELGRPVEKHDGHASTRNPDRSASQGARKRASERART